jgi:hypothetical protein
VVDRRFDPWLYLRLMGLHWSISKQHVEYKWSYPPRWCNGESDVDRRFDPWLYLRLMGLHWSYNKQHVEYKWNYPHRWCNGESVVYRRFDPRLYLRLMGLHWSYNKQHVEHILPWHLLGHVIMSVICFDLQFSRSTRQMTSFCIFIAYINTEVILFNIKFTRWD